MNLKIQITIYIFILLGLVTACDTFKDEITPDSTTYAEVPKSLDGIWQLKTVSRNGTDLTHAMDFSRFLLHLNKDNTYTMENYLPFLVKRNGKWKIDDPIFPFFLVFKQEGTDEEAKTEISYPIVKGKRRITLSFSPGCVGNSYVYSFEKIEK